jgi:hypothetical protein
MRDENLKVGPVHELRLEVRRAGSGKEPKGEV